jgi:hypothetical protein
MRRLPRPACAALVLLTAACGSAPAPPPYRPVADVKQLMTAIVDPAADVIWGSVGTIVSEAGTEERAPKTDEEWAAVVHSAYVIAESGNLMMMGGRAKDADQWMRHSRELTEVGVRAIKAAESKNQDAIFTIGGEIYDVCANCHRTYLITAEGIPK